MDDNVGRMQLSEEISHGYVHKERATNAPSRHERGRNAREGVKGYSSDAKDVIHNEMSSPPPSISSQLLFVGVGESRFGGGSSDLSLLLNFS